METETLDKKIQRKTKIFKILCGILVLIPIFSYVINNYFSKYIEILVIYALILCFFVAFCFPIIYFIYNVDSGKKSSTPYDIDIDEKISFISKRKILLDRRIERFGNLASSKNIYNLEEKEKIRISILSITEIIEDLDNKINQIGKDKYYDYSFNIKFSKDLEIRNLLDKKEIFISYLREYLSDNQSELQELEQSIQNQANETQNSDGKLALDLQSKRLQSYIDSIKSLTQ